MTDTWAKTYAPLLSAKTRRGYTGLYDHHLSPHLGSVALRQLSPELITRWQSDRLAAGAGPSAVAKSLTLLGNLLQRAVEGQHLRVNPARAVRRAPLPPREEVRPLAPATVEAMRGALLNPPSREVGASRAAQRQRSRYELAPAGTAQTPQRDATLISVLAYGGLRPGEALALRWGDVRERTLLIQRAISLGEFGATKNHKKRTVRLLAPLAQDLREWRLACGRPDDGLVFPGRDGKPWTEPAYQSWGRRAFKRALTAAGVERARPYDLRHTFASLLAHERRSAIYIARQLGHTARLSVETYQHVLDELEGRSGAGR